VRNLELACLEPPADQRAGLGEDVLQERHDRSSSAATTRQTLLGQSARIALDTNVLAYAEGINGSGEATLPSFADCRRQRAMPP
jgi:hypothetical protein